MGRSRPAPGLDDGLASRTAAALDRLVPAGGLGLAVSGGGDSMALMALAADWARASGCRLEAITVDHGLRADAAAEAALAASIADRLGVPHEIVRADGLAGHRDGPGNLPAAARQARYRLMADWARRREIGAVALAHTMDDQAETVLMRLARGAGVDGLSAMAPARQWLGVVWLRPLLDAGRAELRAWLRARDLSWADDPTNDDPAFDRVKARRALAALAPLGLDAARLAETAARLQEQRAALDAAADRLAEVALVWGAHGEARLSVPALAAAPRELARRLLARTVQAVAGAEHPPRHRALMPALQALEAGEIPAATLAGCLLRPHRGRLLIAREPAKARALAPEPFRPPHLWDRRWLITGPAEFGLTVRALGPDRPQALPPDWHAIPAVLREILPALVAADGTIAAVPPLERAEDARWTARPLAAMPAGGDGVRGRGKPGHPAAG